MRSVLWWVLVTFIALTLVGIAETASADETVYENVIIQDTHGINVKDPDGKNIASIVLFLHPVPAGDQVSMTFRIHSGDNDTDIDTINVSTTSDVVLSDSSGLSSEESGGDEDWDVTEWGDTIVFKAVTDAVDPDNDADDPLDKGEELTIVITMVIPDETGLFSVSVSLRNLMREQNSAELSLDYHFIILDEGDMFLLTWAKYASLEVKPFILVTGGVSSFGATAQNDFQRHFPGAHDVYRSVTDTLYVFFTDHPDIVNGLTYTITNPKAGTEIQPTISVALYTVDETGVGTMTLSRTDAPGLSISNPIAEGDIQIYLYGENIFGTGIGGHFHDDDDDDDDKFSDAIEIEKKSDPRNPDSIPSPDSNGNGGSGTDDASMTLIISLIVAILGIVLGLMLVKTGIIKAPKRKPKKRKEKKRKKGEEVQWEKPRQRKKRERTERPKARVAEPEEEEAEEVEEEAEEEAEVEGPVVEEEALEEEEVEEDDFDFDDDLDFDELEAELAELEEEMEGDLEAELDENGIVEIEKEDLGAGLDDDLDDLDLDELEAELDDL